MSYRVHHAHAKRGLGLLAACKGSLTGNPKAPIPGHEASEQLPQGTAEAQLSVLDLLPGQHQGRARRAGATGWTQGGHRVSWAHGLSLPRASVGHSGALPSWAGGRKHLETLSQSLWPVPEQGCPRDNLLLRVHYTAKLGKGLALWGSAGAKQGTLFYQPGFSRKQGSKRHKRTEHIIQGTEPTPGRYFSKFAYGLCFRET